MIYAESGAAPGAASVAKPAAAGGPAKSGVERRRFRRIQLDLPGRLFIPADSREARCTILDMSPGGAAVTCETVPDTGTPVVLYVDNFGRFEGLVARRDGHGFAVAFTCTPSKRERTAEQLTLFMNKALVDQSVMRRHERSSQKGFAKFTRADGQIVHCEVMDISVGGVSLKTDIRPPIGEFVLIAQIAGRIARHHADGVGIEFLGQDKASHEPAQHVNLVHL
jgi:hypothetical protein